MSVQATNNFVIVEQKVPTDKTLREFGVAQQPVNEIVSVGEEVEGFNVGDTIIYSGRDIVSFSNEGKAYTAVPYYSIVAKVSA